MKQKNNDVNNKLLQFLQQNKIDNPEIKGNDEEIFISSSIYTTSTITLTLLPIACIFIYPITTDTLYKLLVLAIIPLSIYFLWKDFNSLNIVWINFAKKNISIRSKNIVKRLFNKQVSISFSEISNIKYNTVSFDPAFRRYRLDLITISKSQIAITDFYEEDTAIYFCKFLNKGIENTH